ncbi:MAG: hypothetical protein ACMUIU_13460 [bacterium]
MINIAKYLLATGLFCVVGVVMITQNLAYLVHELGVGIRPEFMFIFFDFPYAFSYYRNKWKKIRKM